MSVLRGNCPAKIDDKCRLKIPTAFRTFIEEHYGPELYVTSVRGDSVRIYPMPVWVEIERKLGSAASLDPARERFLARVNYFGQVAEIDRQGRVIIHPRLREAADMSGEVDVLGQYNFLEVWNHERFVARLERDPFTDDDARDLAKLGI
ncbi:MAG: division/cell wall cluster transcriptional repressor MraZ [Planctomycetes bacterium]|nr:division/cell wall cluster transcriptional repressor MraZ [Planctomycetota bacterium]